MTSILQKWFSIKQEDTLLDSFYVASMTLILKVDKNEMRKDHRGQFFILNLGAKLWTKY